MRQKTIPAALLALTLFSGCAAQAAPSGTEEPAPWPGRDPEATPYVRLRGDEGPAWPESPEEQSREAVYDSIFSRVGSFEMKTWEKDYFEALPQGEPFNFVVHSQLFLRGGGGLEDYIALARAFAEQGCDARVRMMDALEDGEHNIGYLVLLRITPEKLWELSELEDWGVEGPLNVEQLYPQVDLRFDRQVWPEEG